MENKRQYSVLFLFESQAYNIFYPRFSSAVMVVFGGFCFFLSLLVFALCSFSSPALAQKTSSMKC